MVREAGADSPHQAGGPPTVFSRHRNRHSAGLSVPLRALAFQNLQERLKMPLIAPPASDRAPEDRLPHLPAASGENRPHGVLEIETCRLPVEAEKFDQASALALGVLD